MNFTKAQQNAINAHGKTLLVSAAAGSGKTFTLTQRIIKSIIESGQDISRLLIVTFTRAAASELRAKISKALSNAISEHPDNIHLQKQLLKLGSAKISTIDSFFSEPVRANFEKLGLPASIRLSDEAELAPIREKAMQATLDAFFESSSVFSGEELSPVGYKSEYTDLLGIISAARSSSSIIPTLTDIYGKLITAPEGLHQLRRHAERMKEAASLDFFESAEGMTVKAHLEDTLNYVIRTFNKCCDEMKKIPLLNERYLPCFEENATHCAALLGALQSGEYDKAKAEFNAFAPARIPSLPKDHGCEEAEKYRDLRTKKLNKAIKDASANFFFKTGEEISRDFEEHARLCYLLYAIISDFEDRYTEEKLRRGLCEFSDMPRYMLKLLTNSDGSPSEYCLSLRATYDEVYIDEYQDVNEIQDRIFELIGGDHRFMVGDIKQSIYGFREAEPSIFAEYRRRFPMYDEENTDSDADGNTIFMSNNFRCDENVIRFTNSVCSRIFSAFAESIGYTKDDDLIFTKEKPSEDYASPKVVMNIIQPEPNLAERGEDQLENEVDDEIDVSADTKEESAAAAAKRYSDEAIVTANEIARLISFGREKKADGEYIRPGDVAVLVRGHAQAKPLMIALDLMGIKYNVSSKSATFEDKDMSLLVDLLSVIDNPRSDIPLSRLLTAETTSLSPWFTFEETVKIRKHSPDSKSLYDAILNYSEDGDERDMAKRCRDFAAETDKMRLASSRLSADKLLRALSGSARYSRLTETEAYTYLYDCACRYARNSWNGLYNFLVYLKNLIEKGEAGAESVKSDDSVTIMTIHQSKGLEFPVCFLFGLSKKFNLADSRSPIIFSKDFGISMKLPPENEEDDVFEKIRTRYSDSLLWKAADLRLKQKQIEEEARIFYVALTRARERLYLSATLRKSFDDISKEAADCADPIFEIKKGKSYFDQTLVALSQADEGERDCFGVTVFDKGFETLRYSLTDGYDEICDKSNEYTKDELILAETMKLHVLESEEEKLLSTIPAKVAASKVSSTMLDDSVFVPLPTGMLFSDGSNKISDAEKESEQNIRNRIMLMRSQKTDFDSLLLVNKKPTAAEKGTATHLFLQYCDYNSVEENGIDFEIERLYENRFITERTAKIIDRKQLSGFFESELYEHIRDAKSIRREFHFGMFKGADEFTANERLKTLVADKKIFVQGSIDLIIEKKNGDIIICDYKTDHVSAEERRDRALLAENMRKKHADQLREYSHAVTRIFGKAPDKIFIYSVPMGATVEM